MKPSSEQDATHDLSLKLFRDANIKFSSIFQYIPVPISIHEMKNRLVVDVNKEYLKLINFSRKEVVGKKIGSLSIWADEKSYTSLAKKIKEVKSMSGETLKLRTKEGMIKEVIAAADYFNYDGQDYIITSYFDITELKRMQDELKIKSAHIEEANTALRVLLRQRERDREEIEEKMLTNVKEIVEPYIKKLKLTKLDEHQSSYLTIIESSLADVMSPFLKNIKSKYVNLTPMEVKVAYCIKDGNTSKDIAELMNISRGTVDFYRNRIRVKLGIINKRVNLTSYLKSLQ